MEKEMQEVTGEARTADSQEAKVERCAPVIGSARSAPTCSLREMPGAGVAATPNLQAPVVDPSMERVVVSSPLRWAPLMTVAMVKAVVTKETAVATKAKKGASRAKAVVTKASAVGKDQISDQEIGLAQAVGTTNSGRTLAAGGAEPASLLRWMTVEQEQEEEAQTPSLSWATTRSLEIGCAPRAVITSSLGIPAAGVVEAHRQLSVA